MFPKSLTFLRNVIALGAVILFGVSARADLQSCQQQSQKAMDDCKKKVTDTEAAKNLNGNANAPSAGSGIEQKGSAFQSILSANQKMDQGAVAQCDQDKQQCSSACVPDPAKPSDNPAIQSQKTKCQNDIQSNEAKSTQSASNNGSDASKSGDTSQQSSGMPSMPSMPSSPAATPAPTPSPAATPDTTATSSATAAVAAQPAAIVGTAGLPTDCSSSAGAVSSACSSQLQQQCSNGKYHSSDACESFSNRYCSATGSSGEASSGATKSGEGIGSAFCSGYLSATSSFQCNGAATAQCPSCSGVAPTAGATVPEACMNDPAFANPKNAVATTPSGASTAASGSSFGSSGSSGSSLASAASALAGKLSTDPKTVAVNQATKESLSLSVDGGGGGGFGGGSSGFDFDLGKYSSPSVKRTTASAMKPSSVVAANATDITKSNGPSVFSIGSEILRNRCQAGRLLHCGLEKK